MKREQAEIEYDRAWAEYVIDPNTDTWTKYIKAGLKLE
jgi:hypothetical protein